MYNIYYNDLFVFLILNIKLLLLFIYNITTRKPIKNSLINLRTKKIEVMKKKTIILIILVITLIVSNKTFSQVFGSWVIPFKKTFTDYEIDRLEFGQNIQPYFLQNITQTNFPFTAGGYDNNGVLLFYIMGTGIYDANSNYVDDFFALPEVEKSDILPKVQIISKPENEGTYYIIYSVKGSGGNMDNDFYYTEVGVANGQVTVLGKYQMPSTISEPDGGSFVVSPIINSERKIYRSYISGGITETPITANGFGTEQVILGINNPTVGNNANFIAYNLEMKANNNCQTVFAWFTRYAYADHQSIFVYNYDNNQVTKIDVVPNSNGYICGIEFSSYDDEIIYVTYDDYYQGGNNKGIYSVNYIKGNSTLIQSSEDYAHTFLETAPDGNIYGISNDGNYFCKIDMQTGQFTPAFYPNGEVLSYEDYDYHLYTLPENENVNLIGSSLDYTVSTGTVSCECPVTSDGWAEVNNVTGCNISDPNNVTYTWYDNSGNVIQEGGNYIDNLSTGEYTVCVQDNSYPPVIQCKTFTIDLDPNLYTDDDMVDITNTGVTWDNEQRSFKKGIHIHNGAELTINNSYLQFGPNAVIIVEQEAKLTIDHSTLTDIDQCPCNWPGIQVWGNSSLSQYPDPNTGNYYQGYLSLKNNTVIKNAVCAVDLWKPGDWSTTGGIVHSNNTNFVNCTKSVHALYYKNFNPNDPNQIEISYDAVFKLDTFEITSSYNGSDMFYKHVDLASVRGVSFKGCAFSLDANSTGIANSNAGIDAYNAGFTVNDYCSSQISPCPDNNTVPSSFAGFRYGIWASNSSAPDHLITVYNSEFINNGYGIYLGYVNSPVIVNNTFKLGTFDCCNCGKLGIGIYLDNSKMFAIENNSFELPQNPSPAYYIGIRTINTNNNSDQIYRNSFDGIIVANRAEGKNFGRDIPFGLAYYCNQNQNNDWDFDVEKLEGVRYNDIQRFQGGENYSAGNTFSVNANGHFYNNGDNIISYYYDNGIPSQVPSLLYRVTPEPLQLTNNCPTHYGNGNDIRLSSTEYQQRETDYNSDSVLYDNAKNQYDNSNDSTSRNYWSGKMSYYYGEMALAAYDIIRSDLADTVAHPDRFKTWMEKLNTYTSAEAMVDFYLQQGDYTTAIDKVDSLPYRFTFTAYDSIEYPLYKDFKHMQATWLADGRTIFDLTGDEINSLIAIADSSKGTAGAQARGVLLYAYDSLYSYADCPNIPDSTFKSVRITGDSNTGTNGLFVTAKPNPANNRVSFVYTLPVNVKTARLSLYNVNGKLIYERILNGNSKDFIYDCSNLKPGIYYYTVSATNKTASGKLVIVR